MSQTHSAERKIPTRTEAAVFRVKTLLLQLQRLILDQVSSRVGQFAKEERLADMPMIAESKTPIWTETEPEERFLVAGKIHNLRLAVRNIDGLEIPAGEVFSFWKHVGRASSIRGFVEGRELREGCIIPNIGGGLCQLSNALYDASLQAGIEIVERHAHTQIVAGSLAEKGRDATVFWNYIDLRFRSPKPFRIEAGLYHDYLTVRFRGDKATNGSIHKITRKTIHSDQPQSCATCEMNDCHLVVTKPSDPDFGKTAFLVDEYWPEFDDWVGRKRGDNDTLFIPIDGDRFRRANYAWTTSGFGNINQSVITTAIRSYQSRKLTAQGPARQQNLLATYDALAKSYAKRLKFDELHLVVQQNLLPFLWKDGHLGGRTFDVLMTALPMSELQKTLDHAYSLHPESGTLGDFRAEKWLIEAENEALKHARKIVTPHSMIATLFVNVSNSCPGRTQLQSCG
ncbi:MAG: VanW family protein [Blastocatellia bacterium]